MPRNFNRPPSRRIAIKLAALDCFLTNGFAATTIADIRARSGASTGSIYHFYSGKGALALELVTEALASWHDAAVRADPGQTPRAHIRGRVLGLLQWAHADPGQFRFLEEVRVLAPSHSDLADSTRILAENDQTAADQYARFVATGAVRALSWRLAEALMLGPAFAFARNAAAFTEADAATLADTAWDAVRTDTVQTAKVFTSTNNHPS